MPDNTISVIIPTYNRTHFLAEGIESVLRQTRPATEILIIDDGSDERFKRDLKGLASRHRTISVHSLPSRQGVSRARNLGLERARGDYILFLDDDDLVPPTLLHAGTSELDADRSLAGVIFSYKKTAFASFDGNLRDPFFDYRREKEELLSNPFQVFLKSIPPVHAVLMRRHAIDDNRFPEDLEIGEDWYFWVRLAFNGCKFTFRDDIHVFYRRHAEAVTGSDRILSEQLPLSLAKIQDSGMLRSRHERFLIAARTAFCLLRIGDRRAIGHGLASSLKYPELTLRYLSLYLLRQLRSSFR